MLSLTNSAQTRNAESRRLKYVDWWRCSSVEVVRDYSMWNFALGFFLAMHGLIHLGYVSPAPSDPKYPFSLSNSWLISSIGLGEPLARGIGIALTVISVIGFALTGMAAAGFIVPQSWWQPLTIIASIASLLLLVFFWNTWLILGVAIDAALLIAVLVIHWQPFTAVGA
jgi:hypothetical protein